MNTRLMHRFGLLLALALASIGACSQRIEVLGPAATLEPDASQTLRDAEPDAVADAQTQADAAEPPPRDAGMTTHDAMIEQDASTPIGSCSDRCGAGELCGVDACVPTAGIVSLDAHLDHVCMVRDARAYCWGNNDNGRLGVNDRDQRLAPARVGANSDWLQVSVGEKQSCGLRAPGLLYCWGANELGQLGVGDTNERSVPARVRSEALYRQVECGGGSCCAISDDGSVDCWGDNREGKIGQDDPYGSPDALVPLRVPELNAIDLTVGQGHVCAIRDDHTLWCWGRNTTVELGIGPTPIQTRTPVQVGDGANWIDVTSSLHSTCGVRDDGTLGKLFCWGLNSNLELNSPTLDERIDTPRLVGSETDWLSVHAGWFHTCARKRSGALYCWGRAIEGQLGQGGGEPPIAEPQLFQSAPSFARVALGNFFSLGVTADGALMSWGASDDGALGTGDIERRYEPATIP